MWGAEAGKVCVRCFMSQSLALMFLSCASSGPESPNRSCQFSVKQSCCDLMAPKAKAKPKAAPKRVAKSGLKLGLEVPYFKTFMGPVTQREPILK